MKYFIYVIMLQVSKEFMMSPNKLHLECSLDKELYYHGETISVNVHIKVSHIPVARNFSFVQVFGSIGRHRFKQLIKAKIQA